MRISDWSSDVCSSDLGDAVHVDDHGGGRYTLTTTLDCTTDPAHGQLAIVPTAAELCGELHPHYGHYRFESCSPSAATGSSAPTSLRYEQDVESQGQPQPIDESASARSDANTSEPQS